MVGRWIRPWRGEPLCGEVIAVRGEWLICRAAGGVEFALPLKLANTYEWLTKSLERAA